MQNYFFVVSQRIVRVLELAGGVMDEMASQSGPRKELVNNHCSEFMQLIKVVNFSWFQLMNYSFFLFFLICIYLFLFPLAKKLFCSVLGLNWMEMCRFIGFVCFITGHSVCPARGNQKCLWVSSIWEVWLCSKNI